MTSQPPDSPAAPAPAGRSAALWRQIPGPPATALPRHRSAALARPATLRMALRKPAPTPITPTASATLRIAVGLGVELTSGKLNVSFGYPREELKNDGH